MRVGCECAGEHMLDNLEVRNMINGGLGEAYRRPCGIPQGCPLSMVFVAFLLKPLLIMLRATGHKDVQARMLADDILITEKGREGRDDSSSSSSL